MEAGAPLTGSAAMAEATAMFIVEPVEQRRQVDLGALVLIYHRRSGATHMVADPVPQILAALDLGAADVATLRLRLAARFDLAEQGAQADAALRDQLAALAALGLVRRSGRAAG